jgi:uncharacterized ParB-like nuclease family protein
MAEKIPLLTISILAAAALSAEKFCTWAGAVPAANAAVAGVTASAASIGDQTPVQTLGVAIVTSGGAFAVGGQLGTDASGNAIAWASGSVVARAIDAATGSGQRVRVHLIPH